jgi:urease accessory protein
MDLLDLLHIADSSFPSGAYVHSHGLESIAPTSAADLQAHLETRVRESLARFELPFLLAAYSQPLPELDEQFHAMLLPREVRQASSLIGTSLLRSALSILDSARLVDFAENGRHRHQPVVFGALAEACDAPRELAASVYALQSVRASISVAQRLGRLGQRQAQDVLHRLKPRIREAVSTALELPLEAAGAFVPAWDIASMRHERAPVRLFAS